MKIIILLDNFLRQFINDYLRELTLNQPVSSMNDFKSACK